MPVPLVRVSADSVCGVNLKRRAPTRAPQRIGPARRNPITTHPIPSSAHAKSHTYLKMRVLGAIDMAAGNSIQARIQAVSQMQFTDEDGHARQFTWRTIQTWYSRYQKHGVTVMETKPRSDKGKTRKVALEALSEAISKMLPKIRGQTPNLATLYRLCIEEGLLTRQQIAPNTFRRGHGAPPRQRRVRRWPH